MLKYVLIFAIVGTCFGATDWCPSGETDANITANCSTELTALTTCAANTTVNDTNVDACKLDLPAFVGETASDNATDCTMLNTTYNDLMLNSTEGKALLACLFDGCGCNV